MPFALLPFFLVDFPVSIVVLHQYESQMHAYYSQERRAMLSEEIEIVLVQVIDAVERFVC